MKKMCAVLALSVLVPTLALAGAGDGSGNREGSYGSVNSGTINGRTYVVIGGVIYDAGKGNAGGAAQSSGGGGAFGGVPSGFRM